MAPWGGIEPPSSCGSRGLGLSGKRRTPPPVVLWPRHGQRRWCCAHQRTLCSRAGALTLLSFQGKDGARGRGRTSGLRPDRGGQPALCRLSYPRRKWCPRQGSNLRPPGSLRLALCRLSYVDVGARGWARTTDRRALEGPGALPTELPAQTGGRRRAGSAFSDTRSYLLPTVHRWHPRQGSNLRPPGSLRLALYRLSYAGTVMRSGQPTRPLPVEPPSPGSSCQCWMMIRMVRHYARPAGASTTFFAPVAQMDRAPDS